MAEVTKEDINRIYDKLEPITKGMVAVEIKLQSLGEKMDDHIKEHRESGRTWKRVLIGGAVRIACTAMVGVFCYLWGIKK